MSRTPKRLRFDNHLPVPREPAPLPVERQEGVELSTPFQPPQIIHVHQAAPDRTVQRLALGAGVGGGAITAGIYFAPMLIVLVQSLVVGLITLVIGLGIAGFVIVSILNALTGRGRR